jgi:hypothetical protein
MAASKYCQETSQRLHVFMTAVDYWAKSSLKYR